jgi:hypothetical protein
MPHISRFLRDVGNSRLSPASSWPGGPFKPYFGLSGKTRRLQPQCDLDWKRHPKICHPDRSEPGFPATRHSPTSTCAAFVKESRRKFANATKFNRKSGVAQWRDLLCAIPRNDSRLRDLLRRPLQEQQPLRAMDSASGNSLSTGDQVVQLSSIFFYSAHANPRHGQQRRVSLRTTAGNIPQGSIAEDSEGRNLPAFRLR